MSPDKINTRLQAKRASIEKWTKIKGDLINLSNGIDDMCGFCNLAAGKVPKSVGKGYIYKCRYCEPDARELCEAYMMADDRLIPMTLERSQNLIEELLTKIRALPDVYEEK